MIHETLTHFLPSIEKQAEKLESEGQYMSAAITWKNIHKNLQVQADFAERKYNEMTKKHEEAAQ